MNNQSNIIENPLVSVIIPTFSRPDNLMRAINSVVDQTYPNIEIIVVDDNGLGTKYQKETKSILSDLISSNVITYIPHKVNKNGSAARNTGWHYSKGDFINFVDDDDELLPDKIKIQIEYLQKHSDFDAVCCDTIQIYKGRQLSVPFSFCEGENFMPDMLQEKLFFNTTTVLFRNECLLELKGWDESFFRHQDYELYMRFVRKHKMGFVNLKLINKYTTPSLVTCNPLKSIEYLNHFLTTFKSDIDNWQQKDKVYFSRYLVLSLTLLSNGYKKEGTKYFYQTLHYGIPSTTKFIYLLYFFLRYRKRR